MQADGALTLRFLGGFSVDPPSERLSSSARLQALLAYLVLQQPRPVPRAAIAGAFFPDATDEQARTYVRKLLAQLREADPALAAALTIDEPSLAWRAGLAPRSDLADFLAALRAGDIEAAVAAYAGDLLPNCAEEWLLFERERLREQYAAALERLIARREGERNFGDALRLARRLVALDPIAEPAHCLVMRYCALSGDRAGVARAFRACENTLRAELGIAPSAATVRAKERYALVDTSTWDRLPPQRGPLIGRARELAELDGMLRGDARLITLAGLGGSGKTRLAWEAARRQIGVMLHGVLGIPLQAAATPEAVVFAIADALELRLTAAAPPLAQAVDHLKPRELLLVLDNLEHLLPGHATALSQMLGALLSGAPGLRILATSREPLRSSWERVFGLDGLTDADGVALFTRTAQRLSPGFRADAHGPAIARIVALARGLPLAIQLAASSVDARAPGEIADEMARGIASLSSGYADADERHRSLMTAFEQSWRLLTDEERRVFSACAVFVGGFDGSAALAVAGARRETLRGLSRKFLVEVDDADGRYDAHPLLRQFGAAKLAEVPGAAEALARQHSVHFAEYAARQCARLRTPEHGAALRALETDLENILAGWRHAASARGDVQAYVELPQRYRVLERDVEGLALCREMLERGGPGMDAYARARLLTFVAEFMTRLGRQAEAAPVVEEALAAAGATGDARAIGNALVTSAGRAYAAHDWDRALEDAGQAVAHLEPLEAWVPMATALTHAGNVKLSSGAPGEAEALYLRSRELHGRAGNPHGEAIVLINLGAVYEGLGDHRASLRCAEEAAQALAGLGSPPSPVLLGNIASAHFQLGQLPEARRALADALTAGVELGHTFAVLESLYLFVIHLDTAGEDASAAALCRFILGHPSLHAHTRAAMQARDYPAVFERRLSPEAWAAAQRAGAGHSLDSAVAYALGWLRGRSA
jgi:predicted ATPase/DNA-binding SARP family transcriptional activator